MGTGLARREIWPPYTRATGFPRTWEGSTLRWVPLKLEDVCGRS